MQVNIYLEVNGQEALATGSTPSYWSYSVRPCEGESWETSPSKGAKLIAERVAVTFPARDVCVQQAIAHLRAEQTRIYAEAATQVQELKQREENLLALAYTPQDGVEVI